MRTSLALAMLVLPLALAAAPARAERSFDGCAGFIDALPAVITKQGVWCLREHLATSLASGPAIAINAHNVTLDCNGYGMNTTASMANTAIGVRSSGRNVVTVRACRLNGFHTAVWLDGTGHSVVDSELDGNWSAGVVMYSSPGLIRGNRIAYTGQGSSAALNRAIHAVGDIDILDNDINQVIGTSAGRIVGIVSAEAQSNLVARNRVHAVTNYGSGDTGALQVGIANPLSRTVVVDNFLSVPPFGEVGVGIGCASQTVFTLRNQVHGFTTPWSPACNSQDDVSGP